MGQRQHHHGVLVQVSHTRVELQGQGLEPTAIDRWGFSEVGTGTLLGGYKAGTVLLLQGWGVPWVSLAPGIFEKMHT